MNLILHCTTPQGVVYFYFLYLNSNMSAIKLDSIERALDALRPLFFGDDVLSDATEEHWQDHMRTALRQYKKLGLSTKLTRAEFREAVWNLLKTHGELGSRPSLRGFTEDHVRKLFDLYSGGANTIEDEPIVK